jgi:cellulose synthase/poly-beta-1,6-N-acetylglucosamine synthase-like glycosyltransferase
MLVTRPARLVVPRADQVPFPGIKLSIIVPAYREARHIQENLGKLLHELDALGRTYEVIVVSDGNTDQTAREAERVVSPHIKVIEYDRNMERDMHSAAESPTPAASSSPSSTPTWSSIHGTSRASLR